MLDISIFMMKFFKINIFIIIFLLASSFAFTQNPPPPGLECCSEYEGENPNNPPQQYLDCIAAEEAEPGSYCSPVVPIDNSIYILLAGFSGSILVLMVVYREIKRKKTPK